MKFVAIHRLTGLDCNKLTSYFISENYQPTLPKMLSRLSDSLSAFNWVPQLRMFCCCCELYPGMRLMSIFLGLVWIVNAFDSFMWRNPDLLVGPFLGKFSLNEMCLIHWNFSGAHCQDNLGLQCHSLLLCVRGYRKEQQIHHRSRLLPPALEHPLPRDPHHRQPHRQREGSRQILVQVEVQWSPVKCIIPTKGVRLSAPALPDLLLPLGPVVSPQEDEGCHRQERPRERSPSPRLFLPAPGAQHQCSRVTHLKRH